MLYGFAILYGFAHCGFSTSMGALVGDIFRLSLIGTIIGLLDVGFYIGAAAGPAIGGIIFDHTDSYFIAFRVFGLSLVVISFLVGLLGYQKTPKGMLSIEHITVQMQS